MKMLQTLNAKQDIFGSALAVMGPGLCSAFEVAGLDPTGAGRKGAPKFPTYKSTADTLATILADGYFDSYQTSLETGDYMLVQGTDGEVLCHITSESDDVALNVAQTMMKDTGDKSSADTDLDYGHNNLTSTLNQDYDLPASAPEGVEVQATLQTASTGTTITLGSTADTIGASGTSVLLAAGDTVRFRKTSSTRWDIVANNGEAAVS